MVGEEELVNTWGRLEAPLEGNPTPALQWVDVAGGSLGRCLPDAVGIALFGMCLGTLPCHVWVFCGDSETAEGSIWEALDRASYYKLGT